MLAFRFYCETPFGRLHSANPDVIALAMLIGRSPGALAMKCVNFASLDPSIRASGRVGLSNASARDREVWAAFHDDWAGLVAKCDAIEVHLRGAESVPMGIADQPSWTERDDYSGMTRDAVGKQRIGQQFFRKAVLSSYGRRCCISGVSDDRFLVASHIVPWRDDASIRLHPANGLCLSTLHDRAFDNHLFSLTDDLRVVLSAELRASRDEWLREVFGPIENQPIRPPERFLPDREFLARHRQRMSGSGS